MKLEAVPGKPRMAPPKLVETIQVSKRLLYFVRRDALEPALSLDSAAQVPDTPARGLT
jgi:hypothetical protein